jgi:hypothetical protein
MRRLSRYVAQRGMALPRRAGRSGSRLDAAGDNAWHARPAKGLSSGRPQIRFFQRKQPWEVSQINKLAAEHERRRQRLLP